MMKSTPKPAASARPAPARCSGVATGPRLRTGIVIIAALAALPWPGVRCGARLREEST
jgi:hypothetical protein